MSTIIEPSGICLHVTSPAGDDFFVTSTSMCVKDVKESIATVLPGLDIRQLSNASSKRCCVLYRVNACLSINISLGTLGDEDFIVDRDEPVEISYLLAGGGFEVVKSYPDFANVSKHYII